MADQFDLIYPNKFSVITGALPMGKKGTGLMYYLQSTNTDQDDVVREQAVRSIGGMLAQKLARPAGVKHPVVEGVKNAKDFALTHAKMDRLVEEGIIPIQYHGSRSDALFPYSLTTTLKNPNDGYYFDIATVTVMLTLLRYDLRDNALWDLINYLCSIRFLSDAAWNDVGHNVCSIQFVPDTMTVTEPLRMELGSDASGRVYSWLSDLLLMEPIVKQEPMTKKQQAEVLHTITQKRQPGWYWVRTAMTGRTPHKKWVPLEWYYDPLNEECDLEPYVWLDSQQEEFHGKIVRVGARIDEPTA